MKKLISIVFTIETGMYEFDVIIMEDETDEYVAFCTSITQMPYSRRHVGGRNEENHRMF